MPQSERSDKARRFLSGYARSVDEWQLPEHQAIRAFQMAMEVRSRKEVRASLAGMAAAGLDLNTFVIQDMPQSWFNLAPFFLSKGTGLSAGYLEELIVQPGVDLNRHKAQVYDQSRRHLPGNEPIIKPFTHTFMVGWAESIRPALSKDDQSLTASRQRMASRLMDLLSGLSLDWNQQDSLGNGVAHDLFAYASGEGCLNALPWLLDRGLDLSIVNDAGQTPASFARTRLLKHKDGKSAIGTSAMGSLADYEQALCLFEECQLSSLTAAAAPPRRAAGQRL